MKRTLALLLATAAATLSACAPVYHTGYNFLPPADPAGQGCASACEAQYSRCRSNGTSLKFKAACDAAYRSCFTGCGGAIQTSTVCVDHCYGEPKQLVRPPAPGTVPVPVVPVQ